MILQAPDIERLVARQADITVIGGGPLGICTALDLARRGWHVLLLESGGLGRKSARPDLAADELLTPDTHHAPQITVARRLGGAGNLWGGRCVPSDPIDFQRRPWLDLPDWPVGPEELAPYLGPACAALGAGAPVFDSPVPRPVRLPEGFEASRLERWSNEPRTHILHRKELAQRENLVVATDVTVVDMIHDGAGQVTALALHLHSRGTRAELPVREVVLAAGGNASTRLLLNMQAQTPVLFGGPDGPLGRFYMGHLNGQIADILFDDTALHDALGFHVDAHGSYVRRRITPTDATMAAQKLTNIAFWPVVPEISQPEHRSGPLSAVFLGLSAPVIGPRIVAEAIRLKHLGPTPRLRWPHIRNILRDPVSTALFVPSFLWRRYLSKYRIPGFFLNNTARLYGLEFHAEHLPARNSRLTLSTARDETGLRRLRIDFRFSEADVESVLKAHRALEDWLAAGRLGRLQYRFAPDRLAEGVLSEARHGNHQEGTIRMAHERNEGIVDSWGTTFDLHNLHVVSTAILPTSSQANPTLTALQIGLRLSKRLSERPVRAQGTQVPTTSDKIHA